MDSSTSDTTHTLNQNQNHMYERVNYQINQVATNIINDLHARWWKYVVFIFAGYIKCTSTIKWANGLNSID
jgi:hypothetical protein